MDDEDFFSGTFDDPGEPGFSGPSYEGQYGTDSEGDYYGSGDVGEDQEIDKISAQFDALNQIQNSRFNFNKDYAVMDASGEIRGFDPRGGRYGADDTAFFSRAIGEYDIARDVYGGVNRDTGFMSSAQRGFEGLANGIAERYGTSMLRDYTVIPGKGYVGEVFEDYPASDFAGNLIGSFVPGGGRVDRYMSRELTKTGLGARSFGEGQAFFGAIDTRYAMSPEEEQEMFAKAEAEAEAERDRGSGGAPEVASTVTGTVTRPGSAILGSLIGDTTNPAYNIVAPYGADAFSYFTGGVREYLGFAVGGEVPGAQMGGQQEAVTGPVGFVGGPPEQMTDAETVADDVPVDVQEGAYVLNAAAVEYMGSADVKNMILDAMQELKSQGVDKVQDVDKIELDTQVSLLVSKGEVLIPPQVAEVIGYDRLEKINKRGLRETQKRVEENGQSPEAEALDQEPQNPAEGMAAPMAPGGEVKNELTLEDRVKDMDAHLDQKFVNFDTALGTLQTLYSRGVLETQEELDDYYNTARERYQKSVQAEKSIDPEAFDVIKERQEEKYVDTLNKYAFSDKPLPGDEELADRATMITTIPFGSDNNEALPASNPNDRTYGFTMPTVGTREAFISGGARTNADPSRSDLSLEEIGMHEAFHDSTDSEAFADRTGRRYGSELTARSIDYVRSLAQGDTENAEKIAGEVTAQSSMSRYQMLRLGIDVIASLYESGAYDKERALSERAEKVLERAEKVDREFQRLQEQPDDADAYTGATVSSNPSMVFDDPMFLDIYMKRMGPEEIQDLLSIIPFAKRVDSEDSTETKYEIDAGAIRGKEDGGIVYARGEGSSGPSQTKASLEGEYRGDGFAVRPSVNYSEQSDTTEYPDGVVVDTSGKNLGFAINGEMFLTDDSSLRAGIQRQSSSFKEKAELPAKMGGETFEFSGGQKMKRYNMGATFGDISADISKTQGSGQPISGRVQYRFSPDGEVFIEGTDDGRSGRIGLNYSF